MLTSSQFFNTSSKIIQFLSFPLEGLIRIRLIKNVPDSTGSGTGSKTFGYKCNYSYLLFFACLRENLLMEMILRIKSETTK
jgi:hypothetical protein